MEPKVWLVNDDPAQLMVHKRLLGKVVTEVRDFLSPIEALAAARTAQGLLYLVTDFQMPSMDGLELAHHWYGLFPSSRILIVSASDVSASDQRRLDALPSDSVRLLTSYRIGELAEKAKLWFFAVDQQLLASTETSADGTLDFDPTVLEKLGQLGGEEFVHRTLERFRRSVPEKLEGLKLAAQASDLAQLHALAHSLKGSCGLVGALSLARAAGPVEDAASEGRPADWVRLVSALEAEAEATLATLGQRNR